MQRYGQPYDVIKIRNGSAQEIQKRRGNIPVQFFDTLKLFVPLAKLKNSNSFKI